VNGAFIPLIQIIPWLNPVVIMIKNFETSQFEPKVFYPEITLIAQIMLIYTAERSI
jgi:hypothetical protein